jgi:spore maturation protein CgeB
MQKKKIVIVWPESKNDFGLPKFYSNSFVELGFDVKEFSLENTLFSKSLFFLNKGIEKVSGFKNINYESNNLKNKILLNYVKNHNIYFVLFFRAERIDINFLREFKLNCKSPIYNYFTDNPFVLVNRIEKYFEFFNSFECFFVWSNSLIPIFYQLGAQKVVCIPFGVDKNQFLKYNKLKKNVISYFGAWGPIQEHWLKFDNLKIYGPNWENKSLYSSEGGLKYNMSKVINETEITINFSRAEHLCLSSMKTFEIPAASSLMLLNRSDDNEIYFEDQKSAIYFDSYYELKDIIKFLQNKKSLIKKITINGFNEAKNHSYSERVKYLLKIHDEIK